MKQLLITFTVVFVASLASTLSGALIYNTFWATPETMTIACEDPTTQLVPKLNW